MKVLHLATSLLNSSINQPRINPLRVVTDDEPQPQQTPVQETDRDEIERFIKEEFEPFFSKFEKMIKVVENAYVSIEHEQGYSAAENLSQALNNLESMMPNILRAKTDLNYTLSKLPTLTVVDIFTEVCDNPELCLESDSLF